MAFEVWQADQAQLLSDLALAESQLQQAEKDLKEIAVYDFIEGDNSGNRTPIPGIEIKLFTELRYNPQEAFIWAKNHELALTLDVKAFEKIAKASALDFVEVAQVPKAQIASDLSHLDDNTQRP